MSPTGEKFVAMADEFLRQGLRKGAPPLFTDMATLYHDSEWLAAIERLVLDFERCLVETGYFTATGQCARRTPRILPKLPNHHMSYIRVCTIINVCVSMPP